MRGLTFNTENLSGAIIFRRFSIASKLDMDLPVTVGGNDTDMLNLAFGLRYKLCGKYNGTQSDTCLIVCIFIFVLFRFVIVRDYLEILFV